MVSVVFSMWVVGPKIAIGVIRTVLTGHMVSAVCSICGCWELRYRLYCMYWTCDVVCPISRWYDLI